MSVTDGYIVCALFVHVDRYDVIARERSEVDYRSAPLSLPRRNFSRQNVTEDLINLRGAAGIDHHQRALSKSGFRRRREDAGCECRRQAREWSTAVLFVNIIYSWHESGFAAT